MQSHVANRFYPSITQILIKIEKQMEKIWSKISAHKVTFFYFMVTSKSSD